MFEQFMLALLAFLLITLLVRVAIHMFHFVWNLLKYALILAPAAVCVVCWLTGNIFVGILSTVLAGIFYFFFIKYKMS